MKTEKIPNKRIEDVIALLERIVAMFGGRRARLSRREEQLLGLLGEGSEGDFAELVQQLRTSKATTSRTVDRLERRSFVARGRRADDARRRTVAITELGRRALATPVVFERERVLAALLDSPRSSVGIRNWLLFVAGGVR